MRISIISVVALFMLSLVSTAYAGRLGSCVRCVTDSGIEAHLWSMGDNNKRTFCSGKNMNFGGDGQPSSCDSTAGVLRKGSQNDPFNRCTHGNPAHEIWVGGEQNDLIVIGDTFASGEFIGMRDGQDLSCGKDIKSSQTISAVRYGRHRDILDVYARGSSGNFIRNIYRIQDGRDQEFQVGATYVVRRYGRKGDLIAMYGAKADGGIVQHSARIQDGEEHALTVLTATDFGVTYGRNDDVRGRFCFANGGWKQVLGWRDGNFPPSCNPPKPKVSTVPSVDMNCGRGTNKICP